ncbi:MAG: four helix bundle protein [Verrucomicrobia bacterium]|nr:four helix bundle protein [Verrucomicrobiota bacterium]
MAKYTRFEELPAWQEAAGLYNDALDLLEDSTVRFSGGFRNQLDRAALSVSNNIAEGFERVTTGELLAFLAIARGSAGEVRSMMAVIALRPGLKRHAASLAAIRARAESCARQITGWIRSIEDSPVSGKRHMTPEVREGRRTTAAVRSFRQGFLKSLPPTHPLYATRDARIARGEAVPED